jgi:hypothetical protein
VALNCCDLLCPNEQALRNSIKIIGIRVLFIYESPLGNNVMIVYPAFSISFKKRTRGKGAIKRWFVFKILVMNL